MPDIEALAQEIDETFAYYKTKGVRFGKIGKLQSDNSYTLQAGLTDKNLVWVTLNDQTREVVAALCLRVKKQINLPVIVAPNEYNRLEIISIDSAPASDIYGEGLPTFYTPDRVGEWVNEIVPDKNLMPRVYPSDAGGLNVTVPPFDWDGGWWPGGDLTLTAPATASMKAWCVVCLDTSTNTLAQITGTEYSLAYTLTHSELAATTITDGYIPLWGFVLSNGQTTISASTQNEPLWYRLGRAGGDSSTVELVLDAPQELTIDSGGAITIPATGNHFTIDTFGDASSDALQTINGGEANKLYFLRAEHTDRTVNIGTAATNIYTNTGLSEILINTEQFVIAVKIGSNFLVMGGTNNGWDFQANTGAQIAVEPGTLVEILGSSGISTAGSAPSPPNSQLDITLNVNGLTEEAAIANGDFIPFYDTTATAHRKVDFEDLASAIGGASAEDYYPLFIMGWPA